MSAKAQQVLLNMDVVEGYHPRARSCAPACHLVLLQLYGRAGKAE